MALAIHSGIPVTTWMTEPPPILATALELMAEEAAAIDQERKRRG